MRSKAVASERKEMATRGCAIDSELDRLMLNENDLRKVKYHYLVLVLVLL